MRLLDVVLHLGAGGVRAGLRPRRTGAGGRQRKESAMLVLGLLLILGAARDHRRCLLRRRRDRHRRGPRPDAHDHRRRRVRHRRPDHARLPARRLGADGVHDPRPPQACRAQAGPQPQHRDSVQAASRRSARRSAWRTSGSPSSSSPASGATAGAGAAGARRLPVACPATTDRPTATAWTTATERRRAPQLHGPGHRPTRHRDRVIDHDDRPAVRPDVGRRLPIDEPRPRD